MALKKPEEPFSEIASAYDSSFSDKPHVRALRERVQQLMLEAFPHKGRILELGCGTGLDAMALARQGFRVVATDPAHGMLRTASALSKDLDENIAFLQLRAEHMSCIRDHTFDGILSNFGALNCVRDLEHVIGETHRVLNENGVFILNLISKFSIVETLAYLRHGQAGKAFRRWKRGGVSVPVGSGHVLTWYHSFSSLKKMLRGRFTIQKVIGLNILTPTPAFEDAYRRHPRLVKIASTLERGIDSLPVFSTLGDHFVVVLERFE